MKKLILLLILVGLICSSCSSVPKTIPDDQIDMINFDTRLTQLETRIIRIETELMRLEIENEKVQNE